MGTNNFSIQNASKAFAVNIGNFLDDPSFVEYDDNKELEAVLMTKLKQSFPDVSYSILNSDDGRLKSERYSRSFPETLLGGLSCKKNYIINKHGEYITLNIIISVVARAAYYEGANLDYHVHVDCDYVEDHEIGNQFIFLADHRRLYNVTETKAAQVDTWAAKWIDSQSQTMAIAIEACLEQITTPLNKVAQFSNGTAMYRLAS